MPATATPAQSPARSHPRRRRPLARTLVAVAVLGLAVPASSAVTATPAGADSSIDTTGVDHRRTIFDMQLMSRTYDPVEDNWSFVVDATLTSNRVCVPLVFDCIVGELGPLDVQLRDLECRSSLWNHLLVFRDHCLKQVFHVGHNQKFRFTWETAPGVSTGQVTLRAEFGRGVLPAVFQQLATAELVVDLDSDLDLALDCPGEVDSGAALDCEVTVSNPATAGPAVAATLVLAPDGAVLSGGTLTQDGGAPAWACAALTCTASVAPGESATFAYATTAPATSTGGDGTVQADLTWGGGSATVTDPVVVVGTGDVELEIEKLAQQATVAPGGQVSWVVEVTNTGGTGGADLDATDVVIGDIAPGIISDLVVQFQGGVGTWTCDGDACAATSMPLGSATFLATGTVDADAPPGLVVNEVGVTWDNDILGPDHPVTAGAPVEVLAATTTTTTTTTTVPATTTTTTTVPAPGPVDPTRPAALTFAG